MSLMSCDKKYSHSEQRCNTDIILEIKNCITQILLTQGQKKHQKQILKVQLTTVGQTAFQGIVTLRIFHLEVNSWM